MKLFITTATFVSVWLNLAVAIAPAQTVSPIPRSPIDIAYVEPRNPAYQAIFNRLRERKVLEALQSFLAPLRLPRKIAVQVDQCGSAHRPYVAGGAATICYELVDQIEKVAAGLGADIRGSVIAGAFIQVTLYEVAHAILDVLQFPVWGRMGDGADRLAAFVMLHFGEDLALRTISATARFFEASKKTWTGSAFADINSPEEQRFYNYLCIAFGGAPLSFEFLVKAEQNAEPILPRSRARRCRGEHAQVRQAFNLRIMPFIDPDLLVSARSSDWLLPADIK